MRLVLREYLGMLRESGEFDALLPDLLVEMGITPVSKPQVGVRQGGVDLAGVGPNDAGVITLWLFVLKRGDLGRQDWESSPQAVRPSLAEILDVYLQNHVAPKHRGLPVKIVVATTGEFKQEIEQNKAGYATANTTADRSYEFWNGDQVSVLLEKYLLNEFLLPLELRSQLRRALALVGDPEYDLEHYFALLQNLLKWEAPGKGGKKKSEVSAVRALRTTHLALGVLCAWAAAEGNLRNGLLAAERTVLSTWDAIRKNELMVRPKVIHAYIRLIQTYLKISAEYFNKVQPCLHTRDALAVYTRESALLRARVFEEIGLISSIGLSHLLWGRTVKDKRYEEGGQVVANSLVALLSTHPCSGTPCYDGNAIDIVIALLFLTAAGKVDQAKAWVADLAHRVIFGFRVGRWFPISTDSLDDLVAIEVDRSSVDISKLMETSWLLPTLAQWAAFLGDEATYTKLVQLQAEELKKTCFQLWYPDEASEDLVYRTQAHYRSGVSEAPIVLPATAAEMLTSIKKMRAEAPVKFIPWSVATAGVPWLLHIANRHFRTPVDPATWQLPLMELPANAEPVYEAGNGGRTTPRALRD